MHLQPTKLILATVCLFGLSFSSMVAAKDFSTIQQPWKWQIAAAEEPVERLVITRNKPGTGGGEWSFRVTWLQEFPFKEHWNITTFYTGKQYKANRLRSVTLHNSNGTQTKLALKKKHATIDKLGFFSDANFYPEDIPAIKKAKSMTLLFMHNNEPLPITLSLKGISKQLDYTLKGYRYAIANEAELKQEKLKMDALKESIRRGEIPGVSLKEGQ